VGPRNFTLACKSDRYRQHGVPLRIKAGLAVMLFTFTSALASAQKHPKNEFGFLLGAIVTPHLNSASANGSLTRWERHYISADYARQLMSERAVGLYAGGLVLRF
jgi:hypothetical protein